VKRAELPTVLLTGFAPFGGEEVNPSWEAVRVLQGARVGGHRLEAHCLPVAFGGATTALRKAIAQVKPRLVVCVGQAGGRTQLSLERVAINIDDARIPDNAGAQPIDTPVVAGGPAAHFTTLPVKAMVAALRGAGHPAELSHSAGTFVCNHVFYALQHALRARRSVRSGFMHLPLLPEQARAGQPSLALQAMTDGTALALLTALRLRGGDLRASEGTLD
jgi:pyroglutamyl-peptidase